MEIIGSGRLCQINKSKKRASNRFPDFNELRDEKLFFRPESALAGPDFGHKRWAWVLLCLPLERVGLRTRAFRIASSAAACVVA